mmetsp:Transcript_80187/g.201776  ORF Transcript_80187/g.201776 Transcript_80187/m.201776 type:complete len:152 (-) Transcript_80187:357-812(-)
MSKAPKMSQAELLEQLSPPPFNQSKAVPADATVTHSPEERWWRSDSPRGGEFPEQGKEGGGMSGTQGVLGAGLRSGPGCFVTASQTGSVTAAHFKDDQGAPATIPGYGGHIAGKHAGNIIGGTYEKSNQDAVEHLKTTSQVLKYPASAAGV